MASDSEGEMIDPNSGQQVWSDLVVRARVSSQKVRQVWCPLDNWQVVKSGNSLQFSLNRKNMQPLPGFKRSDNFSPDYEDNFIP